MKTVRDVIIEQCEKKMEDEGIDIDAFSLDLMAFNDTSIRCAVVYDDMSLPREFVIIGLKPNLNDEWLVSEFHWRDTDFDGIDAMNTANDFLRG